MALSVAGRSRASSRRTAYSSMPIGYVFGARGRTPASAAAWSGAALALESVPASTAAALTPADAQNARRDSEDSRFGLVTRRLGEGMCAWTLVSVTESM